MDALTFPFTVSRSNDVSSMFQISSGLYSLRSGPTAAVHSAHAMRFQCVRRPWFVLDGMRLETSGLRKRKPFNHLGPATKSRQSCPYFAARATTIFGNTTILMAHAFFAQFSSDLTSRASISSGRTFERPGSVSATVSFCVRRCAAGNERPCFFANFRSESVFFFE